MRRIWAVATNTIRQALRMRVACVFVILLLVLLPALGITTTGDETLKGRLQTFVSYGLSLTSFLLCLLTIIVSIYSVTSDIDQRQIYTVISKPIRRSQFLLGKLLGVVVLDVLLLALFSVIIYAITVYTPRFRDFPEIELTEAHNQFLTARAALTVPEVDVTPEVKARYEELKK
ncbi:MAG: ABC transporter permease, partial [Planctomycetota bacterium]